MRPSTAARAAQSREFGIGACGFDQQLGRRRRRSLFQPLFSSLSTSLRSLPPPTLKPSPIHSLRAPLLAAQLRRRLLLRQGRAHHLEERRQVLLVRLESLALGGCGGVVAQGKADGKGVGRADVGRRQGGHCRAARADPGGEEEGMEARWRGGRERWSGRVEEAD